VPSSLLYFAYLATMVAALACFVRAFRLRRDTPRHRVWAGTGVALSLGGVALVAVAWRALGWQVQQRFPDLVLVHRGFAYAATAVLVLVAASGMRRWRIHRHLYWFLFPLYVAALVTAGIAYRP
jgi:hypothetical protein